MCTCIEKKHAKLQKFYKSGKGELYYSKGPLYLYMTMKNAISINPYSLA